jgi:DNA gyrase subunit A
VKKTPLGAFSRPRPSGIIAITLDPDDALVNVVLTDGGQEIVLGSRDGYAVRFNESDVRAMGRSARGVKGMTLRGADQVVDMVVIEAGKSLLTVCEKGLGKRSPIDEYRLTKRGGMGVINIRVTDKNGPVVGLKSVEDADEIMMITAKGIMLRTDLSEVREIGRATQGVRLIRVDAGDKLVSVAHIAREVDEEEEEETAVGAVESEAGPADTGPEEATADQSGQFEADTEERPPAEDTDAAGADQA